MLTRKYNTSVVNINNVLFVFITKHSHPGFIFQPFCSWDRPISSMIRNTTKPLVYTNKNGTFSHYLVHVTNACSAAKSNIFETTCAQRTRNVFGAFDTFCSGSKLFNKMWKIRDILLHMPPPVITKLSQCSKYKNSQGLTKRVIDI